MKKSLIVFILCTTAFSSFSVSAYEKGDMLVRLGAVLIEPQEKSDPLSISSPPIGSLDPILGTKTGLGVGNAWNLAGTFSYILNNNWGIETVIGLPVEMDVTAGGLGVLGIEDVATINILPITVSLQYYFNMGDSPLQPYAGIGLNYAYIGNIKLDDSVQTNLMATDVDFSFDDSFGFVLNTGVDWKINEKWFANASIYYITLETDVEADISQSVALGLLATGFPVPMDATLETSVEANTIIYFLTAGYRF